MKKALTPVISVNPTLKEIRFANELQTGPEVFSKTK